MPTQRNRNWEKEHQSQKAVYRGVDPKLSLKVKSIASELSVPDGKVARVLLEYALRAYAEGDLDLMPHSRPDRTRLTLVLTSATARNRDVPPAALWRVITTWRGFPPGLKGELFALSSETGLNVPLGELINALLRFALKAHEYGLLKIEPGQTYSECAG